MIDIEEGKNAGMWTIGLTRTGNLIGLNKEQWAKVPEPEKKNLIARAERILLDAGADFVAEDLSSCNVALASIEDRPRKAK